MKIDATNLILAIAVELAGVAHGGIEASAFAGFAMGPLINAGCARPAAKLYTGLGLAVVGSVLSMSQDPAVHNMGVGLFGAGLYNTTSAASLSFSLKRGTANPGAGAAPGTGG